MYKSPYTLWSIWPWLSILYRLFVLILAAVTVYVLASATIVLKRMRAISKGEAPDQLPKQLSSLQNRCRNLGQILRATFYLFGFLFFVGLPDAMITLGDGRGIPAFEILNNFRFHFVFAANIFVVLLALHSVQWLISSALQRCARDLSN